MKELPPLASNIDVSKLKQKARRIKRQFDISHTEALDLVAKQAGFDHWKAVTEAADRYAPLAKALSCGLVVAYQEVQVRSLDLHRAPLQPWPYGLTAYLRDGILKWLRRRADDYLIAPNFEPDRAVLTDAHLENWYQVLFGSSLVYLVPETEPSWDMFQCLERYVWSCIPYEPLAIWFHGRFDSLDLGQTVTSRPPLRS